MHQSAGRSWEKAWATYAVIHGTAVYAKSESDEHKYEPKKLNEAMQSVDL